MTEVTISFDGSQAGMDALQRELGTAGAHIVPTEVSRSLETVVESFVVSLSAGVTIEVVKAVVAKHRTQRPADQIEVSEVE